MLTKRSRRTHGKTMFSGSILSTIEEAESDFLLLFDCCNAYQPSNRPSGSGRNVIEVISAVGFGAIAAEPGTDSFTHHLDEALALAKRRGPIKAVDLHVDIISRLFPQAPSRLRRGGTYVVDDNGPVEQKSRRQCPLHYWLSGHPKSITLAPMKARTPAATKNPNDTSQLSSVGSSSAANETAEELAGSGVVQIQRAVFPQVLVSFRVAQDELDTAAWVKWLLDAPPEARDLIKIEGLYKSFSSLVLVRMPVQVWSILPDSSAASFVGFITTGNHGSAFQNEVDNLLSAAMEQTSTKIDEMGVSKPQDYAKVAPKDFHVETDVIAEDSTIKAQRWSKNETESSGDKTFYIDALPDRRPGISRRTGRKGLDGWDEEEDEGEDDIKSSRPLGSAGAEGGRTDGIYVQQRTGRMDWLSLAGPRPRVVASLRSEQLAKRRANGKLFSHILSLLPPLFLELNTILGLASFI